MITKNKLQIRVNDRKRELDAANTKQAETLEKLSAFVSAVKSNSVIYGLLKNLSVWKELIKLISGSNAD